MIYGQSSLPDSFTDWFCFTCFMEVFVCCYHARNLICLRREKSLYCKFIILPSVLCSIPSNEIVLKMAVPFHGVDHKMSI